jgi:signal transduction histidine kinase
MKKNRQKRKNNFFFLLLTPLFLAFILLVIIPIVTYSSDIFKDEKMIKNISKFMHNSEFIILDNIDGLENESKMIEVFKADPASMNITLLKDNQPIYSLIEIENAPTVTVKKEVSLKDGNKYIVYAAFPLVTRKTLFVMLITRYILLIVCFISFYGINKIRRHLKNLEIATQKIASGDYDTPIESKEKDSFIFLDNSLEDMRIQISEDRHQLSRFFAGVSHDLKTPLSSIIGYTEALQDGMAVDEEAERLYLDIIHDKSLLMVDRISSLISYIKITDQGFKTALKENNLYIFVDDFSKKSNLELGLQNIKFESFLEINKEYTTKFDEIMLNRALENLLENAIKYGDNSKPIVFKVLQNYEGVVLSLSNGNKSGITKQSLEHIFEPFYRGDNSRKGNGFGIGLSTVKSIISSHGWEIGSSIDESDNTLSFFITIPIFQ